jgi:type I restriction enzyme R subunit
VLTIENPEVLEMPPFDQLGSKSQIRRHIFRGVAHYQQAIADLERVLYEAS